MKITIAYRDKNGQVEKEVLSHVTYDATRRFVQPYEGADFHENVIRNYRMLECEGKLSNMSKREKTWTKDLHEAAKSKSYWES